MRPAGLKLLPGVSRRRERPPDHHHLCFLECGWESPGPAFITEVTALLQRFANTPEVQAAMLGDSCGTQRQAARPPTTEPLQTIYSHVEPSLPVPMSLL